MTMAGPLGWNPDTFWRRAPDRQVTHVFDTASQRPKGVIKCAQNAYVAWVCIRGLTHYLRDHYFDLREGWGVRQFYATLTRLELSKMCFPWKELLTRPLSTCWRECLRTGLRHASVTKILPPAYETQGFAYARQPYYEVLDRSLLTWNLNVFLGIPAYPFYDIHKLISYMICIYCKCVYQTYTET